MKDSIDQDIFNTKPLLISCEILRLEIENLISRGEIKAEAVFLNKYLHMDYMKLRNALTATLRRCRERKTVVVYGDLCLGFNNEMQTLMAELNTVKVKALNCIDCLLGSKGKLIEIDPDHAYLLITPGFIDFFQPMISKNKEKNRQLFQILNGMLVIDSIGDINRYQKRIESMSDQIGLPVLEYKQVGLQKLRVVIEEALSRAEDAAYEQNGKKQT